MSAARRNLKKADDEIADSAYRKRTAAMLSRSPRRLAMPLAVITATFIDDGRA